MRTLLLLLILSIPLLSQQVKWDGVGAISITQLIILPEEPQYIIYKKNPKAVRTTVHVVDGPPWSGHFLSQNIDVLDEEPAGKGRYRRRIMLNLDKAKFPHPGHSEAYALEAVVRNYDKRDRLISEHSSKNLLVLFNY